MSKPLVKLELITCEAGDWEILRMDGKESFISDYEAEGHSISNYDWIQLLKVLGFEVTEKEISDEDMEDGRY